jgi:hypothetical protein
MRIADVAHGGLAETESKASESDRVARRPPVQPRSRTMSTTSQFRASRIIRRVTQIWDELDHAQRRLLEIQTGVPELTRRQRSRIEKAEPRG